MTTTRLGVRKTYKLYIGGALVRAESGTTTPALLADRHVEIPLASRKDTRDAIKAARGAQASWAARTGYNRGQVLYRIAEMLEAQESRFATTLFDMGYLSTSDEVTRPIDRLVSLAGWCDKLDQVLGSTNPVSGPYLNVSSTESTGVVGAVIDPHDVGPSALDLAVEAIGCALASGNTIVLAVPSASAAVVLDLAEVLATSDVPAGVVNLLTADKGEVAMTMATHAEVNALLLPASDFDTTELERQAAQTLKRIVRVPVHGEMGPLLAAMAAEDEALKIMGTLREVKTVWHSTGH